MTDLKTGVPRTSAATQPPVDASGVQLGANGAPEAGLREAFERHYRRQGQGSAPVMDGKIPSPAGENALNSDAARFGSAPEWRGAKTALPADGAMPSLDTGERAGKPSRQHAGENMPHEGKHMSRQGEQKEETPGGLSGLMGQLWGERLGGRPAEAMPNLSAAAPVATSNPDLAAMTERLVQQILVSTPEQGGDQQVRLRLADAVLPDTEIRLTRGADGMLSVVLETGRNESFQTLVAAQDALKQALNANERQEVRVTVTQSETGAHAGDEGDAQRRSRGYQAYDAFESGA